MSNSNCPGITDPVNAGNIAIDAIFLIGGAVVFCAWFVMRLASIRNKSILKWYLYGFAVIFYCLSLVLNLAFSVLDACDVGNAVAITNGFVAVEWFWQFAHWMILADVMVMLCGALFKAVNGTGKIVYFISAPILFLVFVLLLAYVSLYAAQVQSYDPTSGYYLNVNTQGQLVTAELVFNLIGVIVCVIFMIVALAQMSSRKIRLGTLSGWLPILMIFLLGSACVRLGDAIMEFDTLSYTSSSLLAVWALENFFIFGVMVALIFIDTNVIVKEAINPPRPTPNQPATLAPGQPIVQQGYNPNFPRYSTAPQQPVFAYQLPPGAPQQYYQQQPVYVQAPQQPMQQQFAQQVVPNQQITHQQFAQPVSPTNMVQSRDVNEVLPAEDATQKAEFTPPPEQQNTVSPVAQKPVELPEPLRQTELP